MVVSPNEPMHKFIFIPHVGYYRSYGPVVVPVNDEAKEQGKY